MQRSSFYTSVQLTECWLTCMYLLLGGGSGYFLSLAVLTHSGVNLD